MRVLLAILLSLSLSAPSCDRTSSQQVSLKQKQEELSAQLESIQSQLAHLRQDYLAGMEIRNREFHQIGQQFDQLNRTADQIRQTMTSFRDYKQHYRERMWTTAPGMELPKLTTRSREFTTVTVKRLTASEVTILHANGSATIPLADLDHEHQNLFAYDPALEHILNKSSGTGTDWLLSALAAAENALAQGKSATQRTTIPSNTSDVAPLADPNGPPPDPGPSWIGRSGFTGSYWAPLQERKRKVGSVNTYHSTW